MKALTQEARTKTSWKQAHWFWVAVVAAVVVELVSLPFVLSEEMHFTGIVIRGIAAFVYLGAIAFARPETDRKRDVGMPRMQRPWYRYGLLGLLCFVLSRVFDLVFHFVVLWHVLEFAAYILWIVALKLWTDAHEVKDPA